MTVTKTDATTGAELAGATFTLAGKDSSGADYSATATSGEDGTCAFSEVPFGTYTLTETEAPAGYDVAAAQDVTVDATNVDQPISLTFVDAPITGSISVNKVWDDSDNADGIRPNAVTIHLYANGTDTGLSAVLSNDNGWSASFNVPSYSNGELIQYSVVEDAVNGYAATYSSDGSGSITITNSHTVAPIPNTGDATNPGLPAVVLSGAFLIALGFVVSRRKRRN